MRIGRVHSWKKVLAQLLLLVVPTALLAAYMLYNVNSFYTILQNDWLRQGIYFGAGLFIATIFYGYRFRFITTASLLFVAYFFAYRYLGKITVGEFDAFFVSVRFLIFAILFSLGWLAGFGFSRSRYFTVFWSLFLLAVTIVVQSKAKEIKADILISAFAPVLAYAFYIIYTAELIRNMSNEETGFTWFILKRLFGFGLVILVFLVSLFYVFKKDFAVIEKEYGGSEAKYDQNKSNSENMTKENKDGSISNKDQTRLTGSLNKGKRLVFVTKLDNYFKDGKTPNPLYFTAYYYTKFDTLTQTFETDPQMPSNDLFSPDPSRIPLYFAKADTNVIRNTRATLARKVVSADVYKVLLSPNDYVAPSTSFFCQPIPVAKEYKDQFKSAYRAKMWVSDLNSAYFIYNPAGNKELEAFQQMRFSLLRKVTDYSGVDKTFFNYYTFMPKDEDYKRIGELAKQIIADAKTPIDKMVAIRSYFLGKDEFGQPLFKYSDNPGIPGLPSANKLNYFLFENRKGYCAYFAGATLFLLRSLGIPSRVAAGYLTVDRSSKNPGWYWFYEDQAHAWVQAFFPGYGWIDFDTTVPDANTQQSPQPDGTPPLNMQQAYLVADGEVSSIDTVTKKINMQVKSLLFHDRNFDVVKPLPLTVDASVAKVSTDTGDVRLSAVTKGMHITAASYAEALKDIEASEQDSMASVFKKVPDPVPVDEIKIIEKDDALKQKKKEEAKASAPTDWLRVLWIMLIVIAGLVLLAFAAPWLIWQYLHAKAKSSKDNRQKAFNSYIAATYYLNQLGYARNQLGPQQYAQQTDAQFKTAFTGFSNVYQKLKYSTQPLTEKEIQTIQLFYPGFITQVRQGIPFKTRFSRFLNIYNTLHFFTQPTIS